MFGTIQIWSVQNFDVPQLTYFTEIKKARGLSLRLTVDGLKAHTRNLPSTCYKLLPPLFASACRG